MYVYMYMVYKMFDLDLASGAALVDQLVRVSVWSTECRGFESHLRQLSFSFFHLPQVSFFLSTSLITSCSAIMYM